MYDVFLSYHSRDRVKAQQLADLLSDRASFSVFFDRSSIHAGQDWRQQIDLALSESQSVVVLWSLTSATSQWVLHEASIGLSRGILFPCVIENRTPIPAQFKGIHTVDLRYCDLLASDAEVDNLLLALGAHLGRDITRKGERLAGKIREARPPELDITLVPEQWLRFEETKILLFFLHQSQITPSLVAGILSIEVEKARHHLDRLERFGYVEKSIGGPEAVRRWMVALGLVLVPDEPNEEEPVAQDPGKQLYAVTEKGREWLNRSVRNP